MMRFITTTVGSGFRSKSEDIINLRRLLNALGHEDPNLDFGTIDKKLDQNIRNFQKENHLKVDGVVRPNGETIQELEIAMVRSLTIRCPKCGAPHGGSYGDVCPDCAVK